MKKHALVLLFILFALVCQAQTVYKTKTGAKYHIQTCRYLKSIIQTTVAQAQAEGLTACSVCKPAAGTTDTTPAIFPATETAQPASSPSSGNSSGTSVQCAGTTKAGARCKRRTTSATGRCYQH